MQALLRMVLAVAAVVLAPTLAFAQNSNNFPIVLVHGFSGWGRDEVLGLKYWGGIQGDLQEQLKAQGYTVYTAAVGPFSSNWDRACELYAQIKGGTVDYGEKHAQTHGHKRLGRTFPGLFPQWGTVVNGQVQKVHLVGHSMGGQTIRMLAQLLAKGSKGAPIEESASSHELFAGGKDWVHSITTISTPNQGTLLANGFSEIGDLVKNFAIGTLSTLGVVGNGIDVVYDAKLDQWGLEPRRSGESLTAYIQRVFQSPIFKPGFRDISLWSLSTDGAAEENRWVQTLPNVYYYSYATIDTYEWRDWLLRRIQKPNILTMLLPMQPLGTFLGSRYGPNNGFPESWQGNDGVVNKESMIKDATGQVVAFNGNSEVGKWNQMRELSRLDHLAVVGITLHTQIKDLYIEHAKLLCSLPLKPKNAAAEDASIAASVTNINDVITRLTSAAGAVNSKKDLQKLCASPMNAYAANYCANMLKNADSGATRLLRRVI
ncbi:hypothetical protein P43SY_008691 [Pythium insidiosum]|uniref:Lipase-like C-terminal domain-containing protein n=1 Tax=Pythium insidiosum TaxID=114742 RepID=A0AAD5LFA0_PYTIN|nr:hypothetical protein P43SY_008691 [Pythium insidiosum]